jgi:PAS domain S-box-containing protein
VPGRLRVGRPTDLGDRTYFFEIIPDLLVITGFDGFVRDSNTAWQTSTGWSRNELAATPFLEFVHPEDRVRMAAELERVKKGIFMMILENRFRCKEGLYKRFTWKAAGIPGRSKLYLLGREVTPRANRPAPPEGPDLLQEWLAAGTFEVDLASMRFAWSPGFAALLGNPPGIPGTAEEATQCMAPADRGGFLDALRQALEDGTSRCSFSALNVDGAPRRMRCVIRLRRDADGVPTSLQGAVQRIPEPEVRGWGPERDTPMGAESV